jgi:hypothetical protein
VGKSHARLSQSSCSLRRRAVGHSAHSEQLEISFLIVILILIVISPSSSAEGESRDYDHDYDYERELEPGRSTEGRQGVALNVPNPIGTLEGFYRLLIR